MKERLRSWLRRLGVDQAVAYVLLERAWTILSSAVTVVFIARFLGRDEQGFFTTFRNLLALRVIFELGVAYVVVQITSHEMAHQHLENGLLVGDETGRKRLGSLLRMTLKWYGVAAALFVAALLPSGYWFYGADPSSGHIVWQAPWVLTVAATAGILLLSPLLALLEGMGLVAEVSRFRFISSFFGAWLPWLLFALHLRLFAAPAILIPELLAGVGYVFFKRRKLFGQLWHSYDETNRIDWQTEVLPFQWRIAVSWLAGYLQTQIIGPIVFHARGSVEAGQLGLSLNIMAAISTIAVAWVQTKAPRMGKLIAQKDYDGLDRLFFPALKQTLVLSVAVALALDFGVFLLWRSGSPYAPRVLEPWSFAFLSASAICYSFTVCLGLYLRAHKTEPLMALSVINAIVIAVSAAVLARPFGANGMALLLFVLNLTTLSLPAFILFEAKRRIWHAEPT
jgi:O-antigen/teichoic acid export membrane protein